MPPFHYEDRERVEKVIRLALLDQKIAQHDYVVDGWAVHCYKWNLGDDELMRQIREAYEWMLGLDLMVKTNDGFTMRDGHNFPAL